MTDSESLTPTTDRAQGADQDALRETHARAFEEAWEDLGTLAADTIAPEATYQAWLAHLVIQRLGLLHVVREVDFGARHLDEAAAARFGGSNLMVDLLILREPVVALPRRAALAVSELLDGQPNPKSGLARLRDFTVITELKVSATQSEGLDYGEVVRDFEKLSAILSAAESQYPAHPLPFAFVGIFNNRKKPRFNFEHLARRLAQVDIRSDVRMLTFDVTREVEPTIEWIDAATLASPQQGARPRPG